MKLSSTEDVLNMYESTADSYAEMMDNEIGLPVYSNTLDRLQSRIEDLSGVLVDTACGSGHMLSMYRERYDAKRPLLGVDLSPRMVAITSKRLGTGGQVVVGDMRQLSMVEGGSAAAVINFFAAHHLGAADVRRSLVEWCRILRPGGQLLVAAWEGVGTIDYGDESDIVAVRYRSSELADWAESVGFSLIRCAVEPVEGFPMDAVYLEGEKK